MTITYALEPTLSLSEFKQVLVASGLAERGPMDDEPRLERMLAHADAIVTARDADGRLVGVARSLTDFAFCCYCSDLAVAQSHQGMGIGKRLLEETVAALPAIRSFYLHSAPGAVGFYERAGFERVSAMFRFHPPTDG